MSLPNNTNNQPTKGDGSASKRPSVFISYAHETDDHKKKVYGLAASLQRDGFEILIDIKKTSSEDWPLWMQRQLQKANFVLCVCTAEYLARFDHNAPPNVGLGVGWEGGLIRRMLYEAKLENSSVFPMYFSEADSMQVPISLSGYDRFLLADDLGYLQLLRKLTGQPEYQLPNSEGEQLPAMTTVTVEPLFGSLSKPQSPSTTENTAVKTDEPHQEVPNRLDGTTAPKPRTLNDYRIGEESASGYGIKSILGQSSHVIVYKTDCGELRWDLEDNGTLPQHLLPIIRKFDEIFLTIKKSNRGMDQKLPLYDSLGKCLFLAMSSRPEENGLECFQEIEQLAELGTIPKRRDALVTIAAVVSLALIATVTILFYEWLWKDSVNMEPKIKLDFVQEMQNDWVIGFKLPREFWADLDQPAGCTLLVRIAFNSEALENAEALEYDLDSDDPSTEIDLKDRKNALPRSVQSATDLNGLQLWVQPGVRSKSGAIHWGTKTVTTIK